MDALNWMNGALEAAASAGAPSPSICEVFNFGTGTGVTVFELVTAMERAAGKAVPLAVGPRRDGDLATVYCDPGKAERVLGWKARYGLDRMCEDAWRWQSKNPYGYASPPPSDTDAAAPAAGTPVE
mgnify:CR=1 FL=1